MMGGAGSKSKSNEQSGLLHPRKEKKRFDADGWLAGGSIAGHSDSAREGYVSRLVSLPTRHN